MHIYCSLLREVLATCDTKLSGATVVLQLAIEGPIPFKYSRFNKNIIPEKSESKGLKFRGSQL